MTLPLRNSRIKLSHGLLFWHEMGQGDAIVFLHGSWANGSQWLPVMEHLGTKFHCFAPDLLGFSESDRPKIQYSIDLEVECLAEYLQLLRIRRVYLVGHSLGGWIAASYALKYGDQVRGIVLLAPEGVQMRERKHRWLGARLLLLPGAGWILRSLQSIQTLLRIKSSDQRLRRRRQRLQSPIACKLLFQRRWADVKAEFLQEQLGWLKVPTLVLQGEQDNSEATFLSQAYVHLAPQVELKWIPQAGTNLLQTHSDVVAEQIREFFNHIANE
jgi:pimeloyl-ACP methyl ester carboxylesterase